MKLKCTECQLLILPGYVHTEKMPRTEKLKRFHYLNSPVILSTWLNKRVLYFCVALTIVVHAHWLLVCPYAYVFSSSLFYLVFGFFRWFSKSESLEKKSTTTPAFTCGQMSLSKAWVSCGTRSCFFPLWWWSFYTPEWFTLCGSNVMMITSSHINSRWESDNDNGTFGCVVEAIKGVIQFFRWINLSLLKFMKPSSLFHLKPTRNLHQWLNSVWNVT